MVARPSARFPLWAWALAGLAGCGTEAGVRVVLMTPSFEDPFAGVGTLRLQVEGQEPGHVIYSELYSASTDSLALPDLTENGRVRVVLEGFADDSLSLLLAGGATPWIEPQDGGEVEAVVCFCRVATLRAGACSCPEPVAP